AAEDTKRDQRLLETRVEPAEELGELPVVRHRVRDARRADHARVRGDEENRRGEDADVDLQDVEHGSRDTEVLDETENGVVREASLLGGKPEERLVLAVHKP